MTHPDNSTIMIPPKLANRTKSIAKKKKQRYTANIMDFEQIHIPLEIPVPQENGSNVHIDSRLLTFAAQQAFERLSFTFTREHLEHLISVALDPANSPNDRSTAAQLLENANIAAKGMYPLCQDTGTAQVFAWKENGIDTGASDDVEALSKGALGAYESRNLRFSTTIPDSLFCEHDPHTNGPAQILVQCTPKTGEDIAYRFLFCAKGGGSANKTGLIQATKALLNEEAFTAYLRREIAALGTAACPPYTIAVVVGGISPEQNLLTLKLATAGLYSHTIEGHDYRVMGALPLRCPEWEQRVLDIAADTGLGAQFGGRALAVSAIVLRLPRHGASCPVSLGVSCSAHRNLYGYINSRGFWLEKTIDTPERLPGFADAVSRSAAEAAQTIEINLDKGIEAARNQLSGMTCGTALVLSGNILVARDAAHARWRQLLNEGKALPDYLREYAILYAGPARTPIGAVTGSFGPTTAGRMDEYADDLMSRGAALITVAKGNRNAQWQKACKKYGAFYLGTVGGAAALIAERHVLNSEVIDYPELGMEAVRLLKISRIPACMITNDKGEDFYTNIIETHFQQNS